PTYFEVFLKQITYVSSATDDVTFDTVLSILDIAHPANKEHGISGMLIYDGNHFLQYFEGEDAEVEGLWSNIKEDQRHHSIRVMTVSEITERRYPFWTMGYLNHKPKVTKLIESITGRPAIDPKTITGEEAESLLFELSKML
ncbi:MAG: BLUF domain-containing protein, partial [Sulfurimonadaceae bacterium]|nr:BLUF domain-containing protein [Sulfurimonadaceae bacterium]